MANFCEIDSTTNEVKRVCIVDNNIQTSNGPLGENDKHADGVTWCNNFWGTDNSYWLQTSFSKAFRGRYAKPGDIYLANEDRFIEAQPYASWVRNDYSLIQEIDWLPPEGFVPEASKTYTVNGTQYYWESDWDETIIGWRGIKSDDPNDNNEYKYNFTNNTWEVIS
jgi:hypothetical protein